MIPTLSKGLNGTFEAMSAVSELLNLEAASGGIIPKGASAIRVYMQARDSAIANDKGVWLGHSDTEVSAYHGDVGIPIEGTGANDKYASSAGWIRCDANGDCWLDVRASGTNTMDVIIDVHAVMLR